MPLTLKLTRGKMVFSSRRLMLQRRRSRFYQPQGPERGALYNSTNTRLGPSVRKPTRKNKTLGDRGEGQPNNGGWSLSLGDGGRRGSHERRLWKRVLWETQYGYNTVSISHPESLGNKLTWFQSKVSRRGADGKAGDACYGTGSLVSPKPWHVSTLLPSNITHT